MVRNFGGTFDQVAFRLVALLFLSNALQQVVFGIDLAVEAADALDMYFCRMLAHLHVAGVQLTLSSSLELLLCNVSRIFL